MDPKFSLKVAVALAACVLLTGCPKDFHVVLFNNTDDPVVCRRRDGDPAPAAVFAGAGVEITGVSGDALTIERRGRTRRYLFPLAYADPQANPAPGYRAGVPNVGRSYRLQLADDNQIYLLRRGESFRDRGHAEQPTGFPLVPTFTPCTAPAPARSWRVSGWRLRPPPTPR